MAHIRKEIAIDAPPEQVWDALRDRQYREDQRQAMGSAGGQRR